MKGGGGAVWGRGAFAPAAWGRPGATVARRREPISQSLSAQL